MTPQLKNYMIDNGKTYFEIELVDKILMQIKTFVDHCDQ